MLQSHKKFTGQSDQKDVPAKDPTSTNSNHRLEGSSVLIGSVLILNRFSFKI